MCIRGPRILLIGMALVALLAGVAAPRAWGADPQPYVVHFNSTGNGALNALLRASSQLDSLRKTAPVGPFALVDRAQQDIGRLQSALQSFGYYRSRALISIEGHSLNDPALPDLLAALPKDHAAKIELRFELGPLYHLGNISVTGAVSAGARAALKLKEGDPAVAQTVLDARQRLLTQLEEEGHAYASVDEPVATLRDADQRLDVGFAATPGPVYTLGAIGIEGLKLVKEPFVRRQLTIHGGDAYRATAVEQAREALLNLGVFAAVSVRLPPREQVAGTVLPVTFVMAERKRHAVTLSGEYSSDLGVVAGVGWTDRNVFGRADQLTISGNIFGLGGNGTATNGVSYDATAQLTIPDFYAPTQSLQFELQFLKPELTAYTQVAAISGATLSRKLSSVWTVSAGITLEEERVEQTEVYPCQQIVPKLKAARCYYTLLSAPLTAHYDSTDLVNPLLDPVHGFRAQFLLTPTETLYGPHATFAIVQINGSTYFDLSHLGWSEPGRSVFALRALYGKALGAGQLSLPPDLRFYAGGSATVRGYAYQGLGPTFPEPETPGEYPEGGTGITAESIEFRQRVWGNFGLAVFVDGGAILAPGAVTDAGTMGSGSYGLGYGGGPRYYTPIGPIRLDVALPMRRPRGGDAFEAYIGIGQAF